MSATATRTVRGPWEGSQKGKRTVRATGLSTIRQHFGASTDCSALEKLPHLTGQVCALWGHGEFEPFANRLIMEARDGKRQGLPWEAALELLFLVELSIAKRALVASQVTGKSFSEMYKECKVTARRGNASSADPWEDPHRETRETKQARLKPSQPAKKPPAKKSWWQRLFG